MSRPLLPIALLLLLGCGDKGEVTDNDNDGYSAEEDCDDAHPGIHPGATERCNGKDDDCDAAVDDGVLVAYWPDGDGDGYGRSEGSVEGCAAPSGYAAVDGDCDDDDNEVHPGVEELCNGLDDDCDGEADPGAPEVAFTDADGDGYGDSTARTRTCVLADDQSWVGEDCDDTDPSRSPGAEEVCGDGDDDDCDGLVDRADAPALWYEDLDGDGYGDDSTELDACDPPTGWVLEGGDCVIDEAVAHPGALEVCDGVDNDCDGSSDEGFDADGDGYGAESCGGGDCEDGDPTIHPGAEDTAGDGIDDDCDGHDTFGGFGGEYSLSEASTKLTAHRANMDAGRLLDAADLDGDGVDDLLVATLYAHAFNGGAFLVYGQIPGGTSSLPDVGYNIAGVPRTYGASRSIGLGDVDGDGFEDVEIGAPWASTPNLAILLSPVLEDRALDAPDVTLLGASDSYFGHGSDVGDMNGDGVADAVIGAYNTLGARGSVYVEYGPLEGTIDMTTDADALIEGTAEMGYLGRNLRAGRDMDGDGIGDAIVPAVYASVGPTNSGITYILTGPLSGTTTMDDAHGAYAGIEPSESSGYCVSQGDVDGDGLADAVISSFSSELGMQAGAVYVVFGPANDTAGLDVADLVIFGEAANGYFGMGNTVGDVDHDGVDELLIGAPMEDSLGAAYLFMGPISAGRFTASEATARFVGEYPDGELGHGLAIGDFDGDGWGDLAMGASSEGSAGAAAGAVYLQLAFD